MARTVFIPGHGVVIEDGSEDYFIPGHGAFIEDNAPAGGAGDIKRFVYRPIRRRMRAKKRAFN